MMTRIRIIFCVLLALAAAIAGQAAVLAQGVDLLAPAPPPASPSPGEQLLSEAIRLLAAVVGTIVSAFLFWLGSWLRTRWGLEVEALREERARAIAQDAALATEEWAARESAEHQLVHTGEEMARHAAEIVMGRLGCREATARRIIDSVLPTVELGAAAAAREGRGQLEEAQAAREGLGRTSLI